MFRDYLKQQKIADVEVASAGFLSGLRYISENSAKVLKARGLSSDKHLARAIDRRMYENADYIFTMTSEHKRELFSIFGKRKNVYTVGEIAGMEDIFDPYLMELPFYERVAEMLDLAMPSLAEKIKEDFLSKKLAY